MNEEEERMIEEEREKQLNNMFNSVSEETELNIDYNVLEESIREENNELPKEIKEYVEDGNLFSIGNDLPITFTYFVLLGQIMKNFIRISLHIVLS